MLNKEKKLKLLNEGIYKQYKIDARAIFKASNGDLNLREQALKQIYKDDYEDLKQLKEANKKQAQKIKRWIRWHIMRGYNIFFYTFTYDNKKRRKPMREKTLKEYVIRAIKNADDYLINYDYGEENGRLHMHGLIAFNQNNIYTPQYWKDIYLKKKKRKISIYINNEDKLIWQYIKKVGFITIEKIKTDDEDIEKLAHYINKLTNHATKEKQDYIATKKGTDYQKFKNAMEQWNKQYEEDEDGVKIKINLSTSELKNHYKKLYSDLYNN